MYIWNSPAILPFPMQGLSRHKGIIRPERFRWRNLDDDRGSLLNAHMPGAIGRFMFIIHLLLTPT